MTTRMAQRLPGRRSGFGLAAAGILALASGAHATEPSGALAPPPAAAASDAADSGGAAAGVAAPGRRYPSAAEVTFDEAAPFAPTPGASPAGVVGAAPASVAEAAPDLAAAGVAAR